MKLFYSPNSPFSRKCRVIIREKSIEKRVEEIIAMPMENTPHLLAVNPLGTVPALLTDEGKALCDSTIICEYLDSLLSESPPIYPAESSARFEALRIAALGDGIMAASVSCFIENTKPQDKRAQSWIDRKETAILRTLEVVEALNLDIEAPLHIGAVSLACALDYVRFRQIHLDWQGRHPALARWFSQVLECPSFAATAPIP